MKLFVAKLNRDAVESDLLEWFGAMGPVKSVKVVTDRDTGQSKCFGFVEMESKEGGQRALDEMNGKEYMGFRMVVKEAEERGSRPPRPGGGPADVAGRPGGPSTGRGGFTPRSGGSGGPAARTLGHRHTGAGLASGTLTVAVMVAAGGSGAWMSLLP